MSATITLNHLADLTDDGDTVEINDQFSLRLDIDTDHDTDINDYDCYGKWAHVERSRDYVDGYGTRRPDGFDGKARKIWLRSSEIWWQPWEGATDAEIEAQIGDIKDLIEYGFKIVTITLVETLTDSLGNEQEVDLDSTCLGGCDGTDNPQFLLSTLTDMVYDLTLPEGLTVDTDVSVAA